MTDISDAADLMTSAREALLGEILPALSKERRYTALMIANAMAIAAREHRLGFDAARSEAARLRNLLDDIGSPASAAVDHLTGDLATLRASIRDAIRAGAFDAPARAHALVGALSYTVRDRVAISNPKALRSDDAAPRH